MKQRKPSRSELRLADLKAHRPVGSRLINVKVPIHIADAIAKLASTLNVSKTEVVEALLNEGLARVKKRVGKPCNVLDELPPALPVSLLADFRRSNHAVSKPVLTGSHEPHERIPSWA